MKKALFVAMVATSLFACKSNVETKPAFDLENAKKEIAENNAKFEEYVSKTDSTGLASMYTTDAKWMNPNGPSVEGRAALVSKFGNDLLAGIGGAKLTTTDAWGDENYVTEEGKFEIFAKDGSLLDKGKYLVLWKNVDGKLLFFRDIFNSDLPIPAPAAK